jgi:predicted metal-dependent peptidase
MFWLAQQMWHIRLSHEQRGEGRERIAWKRACDSVVNSMLLGDGFQAPGDAPLLPEGERKSAEEQYVFLLGLDTKPPEKIIQRKKKKKDQTLQGRLADLGEGARDREIADPGLADAIAGLEDLLEPSMQLDYDWFPGDTIRDGMLREQFKPYPVPHAEILLDTSASVDAELLRAFVRGVKGLLRQDAVIRVGCFDTRFYGFQEIRSEKDIDRLELRGAGGTDFEAAIHAFTGDAETRIIFTDGYAEMPEERCDAIWLVYSDLPVHPVGGKVIYVKTPEERETHEIDFLIT